MDDEEATTSRGIKRGPDRADDGPGSKKHLREDDSSDVEADEAETSKLDIGRDSSTREAQEPSGTGVRNTQDSLVPVTGQVLDTPSQSTKACIEIVFSPVSSKLFRLGAALADRLNWIGGGPDPATMHWSVAVTFPDDSMAFLEGDRGLDGRLLLTMRISKVDEESKYPLLKVGLGLRDLSMIDLRQITETPECMALGMYDVYGNNCQTVVNLILDKLRVPTPRNLRTARTAIRSALWRAAGLAATAAAAAASWMFYLYFN